MFIGLREGEERKGWFCSVGRGFVQRNKVTLNTLCETSLGFFFFCGWLLGLLVVRGWLVVWGRTQHFPVQNSFSVGFCGVDSVGTVHLLKSPSTTEPKINHRNRFAQWFTNTKIQIMEQFNVSRKVKPFYFFCRLSKCSQQKTESNGFSNLFWKHSQNLLSVSLMLQKRNIHKKKIFTSL